MRPTLSIIIPTHKRADILQRCLECLARQTVVADMEVIVVLDGQDAKTSAMLAKQRMPFPLRSKTIEKSQQGVARNRGVEMAEGEIVMFIGDDILLEPEACERHLEAHRRLKSEIRNPKHETKDVSNFPWAVLGFTTWDPACGITEVMKWLETSGWQFGYPMIADFAHDLVPADRQHRFTYTSHISLPTDVVRKFPFREDVSMYGWEDVEWGIRLANAGVGLFYEPGATAFHHHHVTLEDSLKRMRTLGKSAVHLKTLVPDLDRVPTGLKLLKYKIAALLPTMAGQHRKAFLEGMNS